ncbi:MAG TPA: HlyD family secretion protein [Gemmatimonadaceae bacterium]|nr:HlyD family secretion protein [Gemmatimonadaceae bacterium]
MASSVTSASEAGAANGKRSPVLPIIIVIALLGIGWAVKTIIYNEGHVTTDNAQVDGTIVPVLAKVGGYVKTLSVDENDHVKIDQPIVTIDSAEYAVRLAQANADLAAAAYIAGANGVAGQAEAQIRGATSQGEVVQAQIESAQAALSKATSDLARYKELAAKQVVSRQQLDAAQAAFDQATANLAAVQRQANGAAANLSNAEIGSKLAQARYIAAKATRDNAELQLSYTRVVSPVSGIVSRKQIEVGQLVQPGQPLLTLVSDSAVWITANFKETQLADIRVGQPVAIEVDSYPGCAAEGKVESLSAATGAKFALLPPDNSTGNFTKVVQRVPVRIAVTKGCGADRPLRPGMSVTAHVATK